MKDFIMNKAMEKLSAEISEYRLGHTLRVAFLCVELARLYGVDENSAQIAGLLHDNAKDMSIEEMSKYAEKKGKPLSEDELKYPAVLHSPLGALRAKYEYGVDDEDILNAISSHTTGRVGMSDLEKILFIADMTEAGRTFEGVEELRILSRESLDEALLACLKRSIGFVMEKKQTLWEDSARVWNWALGNIR
ncbi:MAG: HD domain-containing protein [Eubacteriaceae bacterium]|nr:HD domain-containing protein [Eubacteriaceae bacterium]